MGSVTTETYYKYMMEQRRMKECGDAIKELLDAMRLVNVPSAVEHYVGKLHKLTDDADPKVRIHVEGEIYAARKRVGSLPKQEEGSPDLVQVAGAHYKDVPPEMQHWNVVIAHNLGYFEGQITKYVTRWRKKNGLEDLRKARHFLDKLIESESGR